MIEHMQKVSIFSLKSLRRITILKLAKFGSLHVDDSKLDSYQVPDLQNRYRNCQIVLAMLDVARKKARRIFYGSTCKKRILSPQNNITEKIIRRLIDLHEEQKYFQEQQDILNNLLNSTAVWGEFDVADIDILEKEGVKLKFYQASYNKLKSYLRDTRKKNHKNQSANHSYLFFIGRSSNIAYCVTVTLHGNVELDIDFLQPISPPSVNLLRIRKQIAEVEKRLIDNQKRIIAYILFRQAIEIYYERLISIQRFSRLRRTMKQIGDIVYITGFVPQRCMQQLRIIAYNQGWWLASRSILPEDSPPTLIRRVPFLSIVQPIFDIFGVTPGYKERDIALWFLPFFAIFFAMIVSDAGYGLLLLLLSITLLYKALYQKKPFRGIVFLLLLAISTTIWGAISGVWFGYQPIVNNSFLAFFVIPQLNSFDAQNIPFIQWVCFIIGSIHLSIARCWRFLIMLGERPAIRAFSQIGWLLMLWGIYSLIISLIIPGQPFFRIDNFIYAISAGTVIIILFERQDGKFIQGILQGFTSLFTLFLSSIATFGDIISYIRLFAVGLASLEVARSFNQIATELATDTNSIIAPILILIIGHGLNIMMGALSVIVHGMRLIMLEFSSHLGMEWNGIPYRPLVDWKVYKQ